MTSPEDYAKAQAEEYGTFVAKGPIYHDGVLAYTEGHVVPKSNVERHKLEEQGLVSKVKKADQAAAQPAQVIAAVEATKKG
jgi:hypothetical protein